MPRVLFIGALPEPMTGQSLACQTLLEALSERHEVDVVNLSKASLANGANSVVRLMQVAGILLAVARRRRRANVIYLTVSESVAGNLKDLLIYCICLGKLDRLLIHLHGGAGMRRIMLGPRGPLRRMNEWFIGRLGGAVVLGPRHVPIYESVMQPDRIHTVPNFALDEMFVDGREVDAKFATTRPLRVLFLSNLLPGKGHQELVSALELLAPDERARMRVDFAGSFESGRDCDAFLQDIGRWPEVRYHGPVRGAAKVELFRSAHLFVLPTYYPYEGQPISILEAYASGCAVITTDHSGILDVFEPGRNGWLVEARSPASIAAALRRAIARPTELEEMARRNRGMADSHFRHSMHTGRLLSIIDAIART